MMKTACIKCGFFVPKKLNITGNKTVCKIEFILLVSYDILKIERKFKKRRGQNET